MKKLIILIFFSFILFNLNAQQIDYNSTNGFMANGYDVVSYFDGKAEKGNSNFAYKYEGVNYLFKNQTNLEIFNKNPKKYIPQYGGWCSYAMGKNGEKVTINPKTFEIRNDKLYLFYNAYFTNTFDDWLEEGAEQLRIKANKNWKEIKYKN